MKLSKEKKAIRAGIQFIAEALESLPDEKAVKLCDAIINAYEAEAVNLNVPSIREGLKVEFIKAINSKTNSRPSRIHYLAETAKPFSLASSLRLKRMIKEIKKPSKIAYIAVALAEMGIWDFEGEDRKVDFYRLARHEIGERAGSQRTFNQTYSRLRFEQIRPSEREQIEQIKKELKAADEQKELDLLLN